MVLFCFDQLQDHREPSRAQREDVTTCEEKPAWGIGQTQHRRDVQVLSTQIQRRYLRRETSGIDSILCVEGKDISNPKALMVMVDQHQLSGLQQRPHAGAMDGYLTVAADLSPGVEGGFNHAVRDTGSRRRSVHYSVPSLTIKGK